MVKILPYYSQNIVGQVSVSVSVSVSGIGNLPYRSITSLNDHTIKGKLGKVDRGIGLDLRADNDNWREFNMRSKV